MEELLFLGTLRVEDKIINIEANVYGFTVGRGGGICGCGRSNDAVVQTGIVWRQLEAHPLQDCCDFVVPVVWGAAETIKGLFQ